MSKKTNKIRVSFVGENATDVTGSAVLIETDTKKILVECGLYQGENSLLQEYRINNAKFKFKPKELDYIILCHSHMDHVGLVPRLYKEGCTAKILAPVGMKNFFEVMCNDSSFIMQKDSEALEKKFEREFLPIYESKDVYTALQYWSEYQNDVVFEIDEDLSIRYLNSGHIINAHQCEIWIKNNNRTVKIGVTSDLGNPTIKQYYVNEFQKIEKANLLIGECTYSNKARGVTSKDRKKDLEKIKAVIEQTCVDGHGQVLIPVFALQRCQTMLTHIYDIFGSDENFTVPIIVDSPLALKISSLFLEELGEDDLNKFNKVMNWKNIQLFPEFEDTERMVKSKQPCVFLSCGGMLQAGRAVFTAKELLPHGNNHIMFCGYSGEGSLATKIKNKKTKTITIEGKQIPARCNVTILNSMTSHMQRLELLEYYSSGNYDKIALVHSNFDDKLVFGKELQNEISKKNKTNKVVVVNKTTEILL